MKLTRKCFPILLLLLMLILSLPALAGDEALPKVAFYKTPFASKEQLIERAAVGELGETVTFYLVWDPSVITTLENASLYISDRNDNRETIMLSSSEATTSADGTITATPKEGYFRIDAEISRYRYLSARMNGCYYQISVSTGPTHLYMNDEIKRGTVQYQGEEYAVDFAFIGSGDALYLRMKPYMHTAAGEDLDFTLFVGAIKNYDTAEETAATPDFYSCIKSISTEMVEWYNMDGTPNATPNGHLSEVSDHTFFGCTTKSLQFQAEAGKTFIARLVTTLVFQEPGQEEQMTTFEDVYIYYPEGGETFVTFSAEKADTAERLSAILESNDTLVSWLESEHAEAWAKLKADALLASEVPATGGEIYLNIQLPGITYTDIVTCGLDYGRFGNEYNMHLWYIQGCSDTETPTVMPGLYLTGSARLESIAFKADKSCTMTYGDEVFTCGILASEEAENTHNYSTVFRSTFDGFDYGVRSTDKGTIAVRTMSTFTNCAIGYLLDSGGQDGGIDTPSRVDFINCGTALQIKRLPADATSYYYRVNDCNFVGNDIDIDVSQEGRFYFHRNFFGGLRDPEVLSAAEKDVYYRTARVRDHDTAMVITNPRTFWKNGEKRICIDPTPGLLTWIINSEAASLAADSAQLESDLSQAKEPLDVNVVDTNEKTLGTWTIDTGSKAQTLSLMSEEQTPFSAGLVFGEDPAGNQTVTVEDSSIFRSKETVLSIPCTYDSASVFYDDEEIDSVTANGNVMFSVLAGGTYTIKKAANVLFEELQDSDLLFRDYGENRYADVVVLDNNVWITAEYQNARYADGMLITAAYDTSGKMLAVDMQTIASVSVNTASVNLHIDISQFSGNAIVVKAFYITADNTLCPQAPILFETTVYPMILY